MNILLFSRCELVNLYGGLSPYIDKCNKVVHLAYSSYEAQILRSVYEIEDICVFKDEVNAILTELVSNSKLIEEIDNLIIEQTDGRFCLNSSIQSDRGFAYLNYDEALLLSQAYYKFWISFLDSNMIDCILHEPTSLFFNHIAAIICKKQNGYYLTQIMVKSEKDYSFLYVSGDNAWPIEIVKNVHKLKKNDVESSKERIINFLTDYREVETIFLSNIIKTKVSYLSALKAALKELFVKMINFRKIDRLKDNTDYWILRSSSSIKRLKNLISYLFRVKYDDYSTELNYYYYPIHLEPEAVVLYWGDGLYKGQIKLIENISAQLPPNTYLYVKDHPHNIGYRSILDYLRISKIPNLKLINPTLSGKQLIRGSLGVITINGSAGLEGVFLNKPVFVLGNAFYSLSNRVHCVKNIKDLRVCLYSNLNKVFVDDYELYKFVLAFLNSTHDGVVDFFSKRILKYPIDIIKNSKAVAYSLNHLLLNIHDDQID